MIHYKKYIFNSKEQAESYITNLGVFAGENGVTYPLHRHTIVKLGFLPIENAVYDEEGNEISPTIYSDKYSVDVLWKGLEEDDEGNVIFPSGWDEYLLTGRSEYLHNFYGYTYEQ